MHSINEVKQFLACETPLPWLEVALQKEDILLIDHAHCEKKAASTALSLIYRYPELIDLQKKLSRLAREELRHFEQVLALIQARSIQFSHLIPSRYAGALHRHVRTYEPEKLIDTLIIGAFIEARSCERFALLAPKLDSQLGKFYSSLMQAEVRHYNDYLVMAKHYSQQPIDDRIRFFAEIEAELVLSPDEQFRFHSGLPV
jgi:tRNA-(ms[2]io[6]A)-hydroxylase